MDAVDAMIEAFAPFVALAHQLQRAQTDTDALFIHLFPIRTALRNKLQNYLRERGIETLIHYPTPPHKQQCYSEYNHLSLRVTERISAEELSLPISPVMTLQEARESSSIENIVTTQDELYRADLDLKGSAVSASTKEVMRYRIALREGFNLVRKNKLHYSTTLNKLFLP